MATPTPSDRLTPTQALAAMRAAAGLSQAELARRLDIQPSAVSRAEDGNHAPRIDTFARWAAETGVPVAILVEPDGTVTATPLGV